MPPASSVHSSPPPHALCSTHGTACKEKALPSVQAPVPGSRTVGRLGGWAVGQQGCWADGH
eukprot:924438-Rhodomonas_salina.1